MKLQHAALLAALALPSGSGFALAPRACISRPAAPTQRLGARDDVDDDWHADYDPAQYGERPGGRDDGFDEPPRRRGNGGGGPKQKSKAYLGPNGHDYQLSEDSGPNASRFAEGDIHALLQERLQAKFARDFRAADAIQMELIDGGVFVHDGLKEWRADGVPYGSFKSGGGGSRGRGRDADNQRYAKSPHSAEVEGADDALIDRLVGERTKFKMLREYAKADAVREGLRTKFDVLIDDRLRQWSVGGDFGEEHNAQRELADKFANRGYVKSSSSRSLDAEEEEYIQHHVDARAAAKRDRNFETADKIRLELARRFDVTINDKQKLWSVGGVFEELGEKMGKPKGVYVRRGGGDLTADEEDAISKMIADRYRAKRQKNYLAADDIRDELIRMYNVKLDDRSNEWRVDTNEYAMAGTNALSDEEREYVDGRLRERFALKRGRSYEEADAIRDELRGRYGVNVDDRTKEWRVEGGVGAAEGSLESLVA